MKIEYVRISITGKAYEGQTSKREVVVKEFSEVEGKRFLLRVSKRYYDDKNGSIRNAKVIE